MPRIVKKPLATDQSTPQLASGFNTFNPAKYLRKYRQATGKRDEGLIQEANAELRDPENVVGSPIKPGTVLTGLGAALIAILDSARLRTEFRPVVYAIGCLIMFFTVALCGGALLLVYLLKQ